MNITNICKECGCAHSNMGGAIEDNIIICRMNCSYSKHGYCCLICKDMVCSSNSVYDIRFFMRQKKFQRILKEKYDYQVPS